MVDETSMTIINEGPKTNGNYDPALWTNYVGDSGSFELDFDMRGMMTVNECVDVRRDFACLNQLTDVCGECFHDCMSNGGQEAACLQSEEECVSDRCEAGGCCSLSNGECVPVFS